MSNKDHYNGIEHFQHIKELIEEAEEDVYKFYENHNKSAGVRVRKKMQELKKTAQSIRMEILEYRKRTL